VNRTTMNTLHFPARQCTIERARFSSMPSSRFPTSSPMRIAYICADPGVPVFGAKGSSQHVQAVVRALRRRGAEVELFAARVGGDAPADLEGVRVHPLPDLPKGDAAARERAALGANAALREALDGAGGEFDLVYERYSLWSFAGMEWARAHGIPGVLEVNAPLVEEQAAHRVLVDRAAAEQVAAEVFSAAAGIVGVSEEIIRYLQRFPGARGKAHVLANGVEPARFPEGLAPSLPGSAGSFTVGFVGSLKPWHGLPVLVEAFAQFHRGQSAARLLIVGDGPERAALTEQLTALGLTGAVHFTGAVSAEEVPGLIASMDVAAAPYAQREECYFSPLKVFEYMAAARAVVASETGQLASLLEHGNNGWLVPPGDPAALAAALSHLADDPALRARLGQAARATVLRRHTWDRVVEGALAVAALSPLGSGRTDSRRRIAA